MLFRSIGKINESGNLLSEKLKEGLVGGLDPACKKTNIKLENYFTTCANKLIEDNPQKYLSLRNIHVNTNDLENLELSYRTLGLRLESLDLTQKLKILRKPLSFPVSSPRTINNLNTDTLFNINSTLYSKGSAQTPLTIVNVGNFAQQEKINLHGVLSETLKKNRLFSYVLNNNLVLKENENPLEVVGSGLGLLNKMSGNKNIKLKHPIQDTENRKFGHQSELKNSIWDDDDEDYSEPYNVFRFRILNPKQKKYKIKLMSDGNKQRINQSFYSRKDDIIENRDRKSVV